MTYGRMPAADRKQLAIAFMRLFVPRHRQRVFHVRLRSGAWVLSTGKNEQGPSLFSAYHAERHLRGDALYAPRWSLDDVDVNLAVIDIDKHEVAQPWKDNGRSDDEFVRRVRLVQAALRPAQLLPVRSSRTGGVHLYLFLDRGYEAASIRATLLDRLHAAGISERPGYVEVWPNGQALRLPLGRESFLLDGDLRPTACKRTPRCMFRDVPAAIRASSDFARRHRVSLDTFRTCARTKPTICDDTATPLRGGVPHIRRKKRGERERGAGRRNTEFWQDIEASHAGVSDYGLRWRQANRRLFYLRVCCGLSADDALVRYERWLREGHHRSRDLEDRPDATIAQMLRDAVRLLASLDDRIAREELVVGSMPEGVTVHASRFVALNRIVRDFRDAHGKEWRTRARQHLTNEDLEFVKRRKCSRTRDDLAVLFGLLRAKAKMGSFERLSLGTPALKVIAGGRRRAIHRPNRKPKRVTSYVPMLTVLERTKVLTLVADERTGVHARIYKVVLPGAAT